MMMKPDFGPSKSVRNRWVQGRSRINKRKARKILRSIGDTEQSTSRLRELAARREEMQLAQREWDAMPVLKRMALEALGYDPLAWKARRELRDLARRAKEASRMVRL